MPALSPLWTRSAALALLALLAACGSDRAAPDVVLVSIDSLRPDHLGLYGHDAETSPTLDALGRDGVVFTEAVSTTSWTLPAHAALFTGLYDPTHALVVDGRRLAPEHVTLAERLRDAGWQTAGFFGGPYLHPAFGLDQGFEVYRSCMTRIDDDANTAAVRRQARRGLASHRDVTGPRTLREVERWIEEDLDAERPYFLFVHLWDVHYDYLAPPEYVERFDPDYEGPVTGRDFIRDPLVHAGMDDRDLEHVRALYDAEIRFTDDILARLLEALEETGRPAPLVVVTADHGEEFFEHGHKGHRRTLFDEVLRIPLVVHWPEGGLARGLRQDTQVRIVDVMPTLLALAGVDAATPVSGRDLSPLLRGGSLPPRGALALLHLGRRSLRAFRTPAEKILVRRLGRATLYDLARDPGEQRSLPAGTPRFREARARLRRASGEALALRARLGNPGTPASRLRPRMLERLRALGYLEEDDARLAEP